MPRPPTLRPRALLIPRTLPSHPRTLTTSAATLSHENPLGLPRSKPLPPNLQSRMSRNLPQRRRIPSVHKVIAVSSAKGGVGKSTIAANLALALAQRGLRAGLLDADVYGPSIPTLLGLADAGEPRLTADARLVPLTAYGVQSMSMGYLVGERAPVAWRGLMLQKALQQLLHEVAWDAVDVLVLDMPPGTGDAALTVGQQVEIDGVVVVSTPQLLALRDAVKGVALWRSLDVRLLGLVQNMAGFACPRCGEVSAIFGAEGARNEARRLGLEVLADVPLDVQICDDADGGRPTVVVGGEKAGVFVDMASRVAELLGV